MARAVAEAGGGSHLPTIRLHPGSPEEPMLALLLCLPPAEAARIKSISGPPQVLPMTNSNGKGTRNVATTSTGKAALL